MYHGQLGQEEGWFTRFTRGLVSALPTEREVLPPPPVRTVAAPATVGGIGWGTPALVVGGLGLGALAFVMLGQKRRR